MAAGSADPVIGSDSAAGRLHSWDCLSGARLGGAGLSGPLTAGPVVDAGSARVYAAAGVALRALSLPALEISQERRMAAPVARLALGSGPGGVLLAAGGLAAGAAGGGAALADAASPAPRWALDALRPEDLAPVFAWNLAAAGEVSALLAIPARQRFVVGFAAHDELWEIAWNPDAPPVLRGLVHDYRSGEAVPLAGRFTERAFKLPRPTRGLTPGGMPFEVLQMDRDGAVGIVNLDVRRRTEPVPIEAARFILPWRGPQARGWLVLHDDGRITRVTAPGAGQQAWGRLAVAPIDAVPLPDGSGAIVLEREGLGARWRAVSALGRDITSGQVVAGAHRLAVSASGTCVAMLDGEGRWLASQAFGSAR